MYNVAGHQMPRPSFWEGFGRAIDFGGVIGARCLGQSPRQADAHALRSDWAVIGMDMSEAARLVESQIREAKRGQ